MANNSNRADTNLEQKIGSLISSIDVLVDVIEKRGRSGQESSMFHIRSIRNTEYNDFGRRLESLNETEFIKVMEGFINGLRDTFEKLSKDLQKEQDKLNAIPEKIKQEKKESSKKQRKIIKNERKLSDASLTPEERTEIQKEIDDLKEEKKQHNEKIEKLKKDKKESEQKITELESKVEQAKDEYENYRDNKSERERHYREEHEKYVNALKENFKVLTPEERAMYNDSEDNYIRSEVAKQEYIGESKNRDDASNLIARSGIGNTAVGRYGQKLINTQQRFADMGNFANQLKSGGAAKISTAMFGNGKAAAVATKALGGFGKALGGVSKLLGGPVVAAIMIAVDALKMISDAVNDYKKYTAEMYENQRKQEELQFNLSKQQYVLRNQIEIENVSALGDKQLKMLDVQGSTMLEGIKLTTEQYVKSVEIALGPMMKGINQSAYDAAMARVDAAADYQKLLLHKGQRETTQSRYEELRNLQQQGKVAGLQAEMGMAEATYETQMKKQAFDFGVKASEHYIQNIWRSPEDEGMVVDENGNTVEDVTSGGYNRFEGKNYNRINSVADAGLDEQYRFRGARAALQDIGLDFGREGDIAKYGAMLDYQNQAVMQNADYIKTAVDAQYQVAQTQKDYANQIQDKVLEVQTEASEKFIDAAASIEKTWLQLAQGIEQYMEKFDNIVNDLGLNMGYTNQSQLLDYKYVIGEVVKTVGAKFGKEAEDFEKMVSSYITQTGRNKNFSQRDFGTMTGLGKYLGDDGLAASYASEMEIFNAGVSESVDMLDEALQDVNRMGLNGRKYTKTIVDSLKLAQKYNFKGGTKGLMEMAKWAENTRFNMNSLSGMLDKVSEGGLEGIITQGAQFQVLGGHAAMNADPIAMMYERYANPEAFAKRMQEMTIGYGTVDRTTGETTFSGTEQMLMEQIAKVQGRSYEDVANEVRARNKKEVVAKQLGGNFNDEQQAFISNNATYNKETGQFQVKVFDKKSNEYVDMDVDKLTPEDLKAIMPEKHNEKMEKYMETVVSLLDKIRGEETREKITLGLDSFAEMMDNYRQRIKQVQDSFADNYDNYLTETKKGMREATGAFINYIDRFNEGHEAVDAERTKIETTAKGIAAALADTERIIKEANEKISGTNNVGKQLDNTSKTTASTAASTAASVSNVPTHISTGARHGITVGDGILSSNNQPIFAQTSNVTKVQDGIINSNNQPIFAQTTNVTKVNDGVSKLVQSNKKDNAIFAKEGGPFDVLFNGIFDRINKLYEEYQDPYRTIDNRSFTDIVNEVRGRNKREAFAKRGSSYVGNSRFNDDAIREPWRIAFSNDFPNHNARGLYNESYNRISTSPYYNQIGNVRGIVDNKNRETMFNGREVMMMNEVAKAQGSSYDDVANDVRVMNRQQNNMPAENPNTFFSSNTSGGNGGTVKFETLNIQLEGKLELTSQNGQSINIISELQNNPTLLRELSRMITKQVTSAMNGGRGRLTIGIPNV